MKPYDSYYMTFITTYVCQRSFIRTWDLIAILSRGLAVLQTIEFSRYTYVRCVNWRANEEARALPWVSVTENTRIRILLAGGG